MTNKDSQRNKKEVAATEQPPPISSLRGLDVSEAKASAQTPRSSSNKDTPAMSNSLPAPPPLRESDNPVHISDFAGLPPTEPNMSRRTDENQACEMEIDELQSWAPNNN